MVRFVLVEGVKGRFCKTDEAEPAIGERDDTRCDLLQAMARCYTMLDNADCDVMQSNISRFT